MIKNKIEELLINEFCCSSDELNGKSTVFSINFNAKQPYIKILAYRNCVVVCTSEDLHPKVQELLLNKNRDEIFELPLVYGQTIHYVPDGGCICDMPDSLKYGCECLFYRDILSLDGVTGFENSLAFHEMALHQRKLSVLQRIRIKLSE